MQYFSIDTHTIYPPTLEIKWDDSSYNTGSLSVISNNNNVITLGNNIEIKQIEVDKNGLKFPLTIHDILNDKINTKSSKDVKSTTKNSRKERSLAPQINYNEQLR